MAKTVLAMAVSAWIVLVCSSSGIAQVQLVFPAQGATVTFEQLKDPGFSWFAPAGATRFEVLISPAVNPSQRLRFESEITRLELSDSERAFFTFGSFVWTVNILAGQGAGSSATGQFQIGTSGSLVPTPTPQATPTPVPPGEPSPTPTPTPAVGLPSNFQFSPAQTVSFSEVTGLTIAWDPPAFPPDGRFVYDVLIVFPQDFSRIPKNSLTEPQVVPLPDGTTFAGDYSVFVRASDTASGGVSNIAVTSFTISRNVARTPTPTPTPQALLADLGEDGEVNAVDLLLFAQAFGTQNGKTGFRGRADFTSDGVINQSDLLVFVSLFRELTQGPERPIWLFADVPDMETGGPLCQVVGRHEPITFPPNEITFGFNGDRCKLAEITGTNEALDNGTVFHFAPVPGAIDYRVTIDSEKPGLMSANGPVFTTGGETAFRLIATVPDNQAQITVQALGPRRELGLPSDPLTVIIP